MTSKNSSEGENQMPFYVGAMGGGDPTYNRAQRKKILADKRKRRRVENNLQPPPNSGLGFRHKKPRHRRNNAHMDADAQNIEFDYVCNLFGFFS